MTLVNSFFSTPTKKRICSIVLLMLIPLLSIAAPFIELPKLPLNSNQSNVHPNVLLNLSVEFPIAGAAYRKNTNYDGSVTYVGYFNSEKCYRYPSSLATLKDYHTNQTASFTIPKLDNSGYFTIAESASAQHQCDGTTFSGNFLNWASASAIDMLRYALTGGDRITDTTSNTVLQRAFLYSTFYANPSYFPRKSISGDLAKTVTPFKTKTLYIVNCENKILFSDTKTGGTCNSERNNKTEMLKSDKFFGEYLVRVNVCDANDSSNRPDFCMKYSNAYKPVGLMQRNHKNIRFAAMSYLLDNDQNRYGGVLRAPMKYIGDKTFDAPNFNETNNEQREWDPMTGIFYTNPENPGRRNSPNENSGVINYLNKFGRTGNYKSFDPVSELFYEGIRYLQGKQPTPEAIKGITTAMKESFPVITQWQDPIQIGKCQRNYAITIADTYTHQDRYIPGNTRTAYLDKARPADIATSMHPAFDVMASTKMVADMESSSAYGNSRPNKSLANMEKLNTGSGRNGTYYLAGAAYWANTNFIRFDKPTQVKTFIVDVDEAGSGIIDASTATKQLYLAAKYGGFNDKNKDGNPFISLNDNKNDTEWSTITNNVPDNYFLASQPKEMISAFQKIFSTIGNGQETNANVTLSSPKINANPFIFQTGFNSSSWSGNLKKIAVISNPSGDIAISKDAEWDAGTLLTTPQSITSRTIVTYNSTIKKTVPFELGQLPKEIQTLFNRSPDTGNNDYLGGQRISYLAGVRTMENNNFNPSLPQFRVRDSVLGDIINSAPVYVGAPTKNMIGANFHSFYEQYKSRPGTVFVGANDGMLHAFSADSGAEFFAFIPSPLLNKLPNLTSPAYQHDVYMDGNIRVGEAQVANTWKTVLAAGMGAGAKGVFALDVTQPDQFMKGSQTLFEFTENDDADIGYITTPPLIAKVNMGKSTNGVSNYRYFMIVTSGYNSANNNGEQFLFLLSLDKDPASVWSINNNYYKLKTNSNNTSIANALSTPGLALNAQGAAIYAYSGDLQGNLWRFDFATGNNPSSVTPKIIFTAKDKNNILQSITAQPVVTFAPDGGYLVLFGTGKYIENADSTPSNFKRNSFYAIRDTTRSAKTDYYIHGREQLAARTLAQASINGQTGYQVTGENFNYGDTNPAKKGWYIDYLDGNVTGERNISEGLIAYGNIFFNTIIPNTILCDDAGTSISYQVNLLTGKPESSEKFIGFTSQAGMLGTPILINTKLSAGERDSLGRRNNTQHFSVIDLGTGGINGLSNVRNLDSATLKTGRLSWREIANWQNIK